MPSATTPAQTRHKTVPPSPLSQSTSAVYQQPSQSHVPPDPLKLTKPRKPVLDTSLDRAPESNNPVPQSLSLPTTPNRAPSPSKRGSDLIAGRPYSAQPSPTHRKERRTSLLGRLARKFSLLRKPTRGEDEDDWHHVNTNETKPDRLIRPKHSSPANMRAERTRSFERAPDPIRLPTFTVVPPPEPEPGPPYNEDPPSHTERRRPSQISLDPPLSLGRLTITNPDEPYGEDATTSMQPLSGVMDNREPKIPVPPKDDAPPPPPPRDQPPELDASPLLPPPPLPSIYPASPLSAQTIPSDIDLPWPPSPANLNAAESSHRPATPQTHKRTESNIPFPLSSNGSLPEIPSLLSPPPRLAAFPLLGTESPLSTASLLVNPPTPHPPEMSIPATPAPNVSAPAPAPTRPPYETRRSSQDRQGNGVVRQTETFKLVPSSSSTLHPAGEKIVVAGHEWEVVESDAPKRSKTKDKPSKSRDREGGSGREHRHRERAKAEAVDASTSQRRTSQTRGNGRSTDSSSTPPPNQLDRSRTHSTDARHATRHSGPESVEHQDKSSRRREEERTSNTETRHGRGYSTAESAEHHEYRPSRRREEERMSVAEARHGRGHSTTDSAEHHEYRTSRRRDEERVSTAEARHGRGYSATEPVEHQERSSRRREEERTPTAEARHGRGYSTAESAEYQEYRSSRRREDERTSDRTHPAETQRSQGHSTSESADHHEHRSSRRREEERTFDRKHHNAESRSNGAVPLNVDKPQPAPPAPSPAEVPAALERRPSTTTRPVSELPSSAELSALRARDAWELERLWKGRSLYHAEATGIVASPLLPPAPETIRASTGSNDPGMANPYGSSHTSYVVHPAHHLAPYTNVYHSMPLAAAPTFVYGSAPPHHPMHYQPLYAPAVLSPPSHLSADVSALSSSSSSARGSRSNPLPAPPRESSYVPTPIAPIHPHADPNARSPDHWASKYTSVQTAH